MDGAEPGATDLRASLQEGVGDIVEAVRAYRETRQRSRLAAVATVAFSFLELLEEAPPDIDIALGTAAAVWFRTAAEAWERPEFLDMAIDLAHRATAGDHEEDRYLAAALTTLGQSLSDSWEVGGGDDRLEEAIDVLRRAVRVAELDPEDPDRPQILNALGVALLHAELAGMESDLRETVRVFERAVDLTPPASPAVLGLLGNLNGALRRLAERTGQQAYLDKAIEQYEESIERVEELGDPGLSGALHNGMAIALHDRFTLDHREESLNRAIEAQRVAVSLSSHPGSRAVRGRQNNLAGYLIERFGETEDRGALNEGTELLEKVYRVTGREEPDWYGTVQNLANALHTRGVADKDLGDLERALELRREAANAAPANPYLAGMKRDLAATLLRIHELEPDSSSEEEVDRLLEEALHLGMTSDPVGAIGAARRLLRQRLARTDFAAATRVGEEGLKLARRTSLQQVGMESRHQVLRELRGIASRTAAAAVAIGEVERAVLALESGQAVLFGEQVELAAIAAAGGPRLAEQIAPLREALGSVEALPPARRLEAREALDAAIAEAGGELGRQPQWADVLEAAAVRPLLYLAASLGGGLAILVTAEGSPRHFECPLLTEERVQELTAAYFGAVEALRADPPDLDGADERLEEVRQGLDEAMPTGLLDAVAGFSEVAAIGGGYLSTLPLHLIGHRREISSSFSDGTLITVTPSAAALRWAARPRAGEGLEPRVIVAVTEGPRAAPGADLEVRLARSHGPATLLRDAGASPAMVLAEAARARFLHVACHGLSDPWSSHRSHLVLGDGDLRAADFLAAMPGEGRLALLSACETAVGEVDLPDEGGGLSSALLQFGFGGVIGTSWPVPGDVAAFFSDVLTRYLLDEEDAPAVAYRRAMAEVATLTVAELAEWYEGAPSAAALRSTAGHSASPEPDRTLASGPLRLCEWGAFRYLGW
jgi:tetratricopeptide (TPR) repeat protein